MAGCSSGAFSRIDQTIRTTEHTISAISSVYTRSGQTQTRSASAFSSGPSPFAMRRSFNTACRIEYHTKNTSRKIRPTMGTLSGFVMMSLKFGSRPPSTKNSVNTPSAP